VIEPTRYVGNSDFHDGYILAVVKQADSVTVTIKGGSGKHYTVTFEGVASVQSDSPEGMMLYGTQGVRHRNGILAPLRIRKLVRR